MINIIGTPDGGEAEVNFNGLKGHVTSWFGLRVPSSSFNRSGGHELRMTLRFDRPPPRSPAQLSHYIYSTIKHDNH